MFFYMIDLYLIQAKEDFGCPWMFPFVCDGFSQTHTCTYKTKLWFITRP